MGYTCVHLGMHTGGPCLRACLHRLLEMGAGGFRHMVV